MGVQGPKHFNHLPLLSTGHEHGAGSELKQLKYKLVPLLDVASQAVALLSTPQHQFI